MSLFHVEHQPFHQTPDTVAPKSSTLYLVVDKLSKLFCLAILHGVLAGLLPAAEIPVKFLDQRLALTDPHLRLESVVQGKNKAPLKDAEVQKLLASAGLVDGAKDWGQWAQSREATATERYIKSITFHTLHGGFWFAGITSAIVDGSAGSAPSAPTYILLGTAATHTLVLLGATYGYPIMRSRRRLAAANALVDYNNRLLDQLAWEGPRYQKRSVSQGLWRSALLPGWGLVYQRQPLIAAVWGGLTLGTLGNATNLAIKNGGTVMEVREMQSTFALSGVFYIATLLLTAVTASPSPELQVEHPSFSLLPQAQGALLVLNQRF